jgi:RNA polymerase primary sigma factor
VDQAHAAVTTVVSLDEPSGHDCQYTWQEVIADERALDTGLIHAEQDETAEELRSLLDVLEPDERTVVALRFGLDRRGAYSIRELAEITGSSRAEVRELVDRAILKLRRHARSKAEIFQTA